VWYAALSQTEMVAMLRSKARKTGVQTSHYRGVSLLKQTHKWHAQINVGGKQVGGTPLGGGGDELVARECALSWVCPVGNV